MISLNNLPVLVLTEDNIETEWTSLVDEIKLATFIAIDVELSGLGNRKGINTKSVNDRYKSLCEIAKSYSVLSWGISCFQIKYLNENKILVSNKTYNLLTLCNDRYMVDSDSLKFLHHHNFDFNLHVAKGIKYSKGNDVNDTSNDYIRRLFMEISSAKVPIVIHNGLIDLIFLYENFYANCPSTLMQFIADLSEIFSTGILDTKYIVENHVRYSASYLEYLFLKSYYENTQSKLKNRKAYINIEFSLENELEEYCLKIDLTEDDFLKYEENICKMFCKYGFCSSHEKRTCSKIHNTGLILSIEVVKARLKCKNSKKKNKSQHQVVASVDTIGEIEQPKIDVEQTAATCSFDLDSQNNAHTSGIDAFMTGYAFAHFLVKQSNLVETLKSTVNSVKLSDLDVNNWLNNVYLTGKDLPLIISKSSFSKTSANHNEKMRKINQT